MRCCKLWPLLALLLIGCGQSSKPVADSTLPNATEIKPKVDTSKPQSVEPEWQAFSSKEGIALRLPQGWKPEAPTKGAKSDDQQAKSGGIESLHVAISAVSPLKATSESFPDTLTAVRAEQSAPIVIDQKFADETLRDLKTSYPDGNPKVELVKTPAGMAIRTSFGDHGTMGISKGSETSNNKVVEDLNVQIQLAKGKNLYVVQLTGARDHAQALTELANRIALTIRID